MKFFIISEAVMIVLQFLLFIPFYCVYKKDCKEIGKEHLAVSLQERFFAWLLICPLWAIPFLILRE